MHVSTLDPYEIDQVRRGKAILSSLCTKYVCLQLLFNQADSRWHEPYVSYILSQQQQ